MHRQRTRFATRVHRVATALERRGVVATYELHDRVLANRASRWRYAHEPPALDETQQSVVDRLRRDGYATLPLAELVSDQAVLSELEEAAGRFVGETEAADVVAGALLQVDAPEAQGAAPDVVASDGAFQQMDLGVALEQVLAVARLLEAHVGQPSRRLGAQLGQAPVQPVDVALLGAVRVLGRRPPLSHHTCLGQAVASPRCPLRS